MTSYYLLGENGVIGPIDTEALSHLVDEGFVEIISENGNEWFRVTDRGRAFVEGRRS